jgi:hypothetical protein
MIRELNWSTAIRLLSVVLLCNLWATGASAQGVMLEGIVTDEQTGEAILGAVVTIPELQKGAETDETGKYVLRDIPLGIYTLRVTYTGYADYTKQGLRLEGLRNTLNIQVRSMDVQVGEVVIQAPNFERPATELVSTRSISVEQIQTNPGGNQDISRALQSLPGVAAPGGFRNDLIIRGGAPNENVYYLDGIEVPNINHFATQGSGGGPTGIIPSYMVQSVKFQTSGFSAKYDNTLSSVLDFELATANSERFQNLINVSGTEAGLAFDTPIGKKIKVTSSIRRSYLDLLFRAFQLPFLPDYWDVATKAVYQINPKNSLTYIHIGALDDFRRNVPQDATLEQQTILDGLPTIRQKTFTQGVVFKHLTSSGYWNVALSRNFLFNDLYRFRPMTDERDTLQSFNTFEAETKLRFNYVAVKKGWEIQAGGVVQWVQYDLNSRFNGTIPIFITPDSVIGQPFAAVASNNLSYFRYGLHGSIARSFLRNRLRTCFGLRTDLNSFTTDGNNPLNTLSPRLSVSYALTDKWALNASVGVYYKIPPNVLLGYTTASGETPNRNLPYTRSTHFVLGGEFKPNPDWLFSLEGFYKLYANYPVSANTGISLANLGSNYDVFGNTPVLGVGDGRAYGAEFLAQKAFSGNFYGILAYTLYWSEFSGLTNLNERPVETEFIRSAWDYRHIITVTAGWRFGKKQSWELSGRLRLSGGLPYTPVNVELSRLIYPVTGQAVEDFTRLNQAQTGFFAQADLRIDKRWFFKKWTLNLYMDLQNALPLDNPGPPSFTLLRDGMGFQTGPNNFTFLTDASTTLVPSIGIRVKY